MPMLTISGRAHALEGDPAGGDLVTDPEVLERIHGMNSGDDLCAEFFDTPALAGLGLSGGRLRFVHEQEGGGLRITTSYLVPTRLGEAETDMVVEATLAQWSDGLGSASFENHCAQLLSTTLAMAIRNQDPGGLERYQTVYLDAFPALDDRDVRVEWSDEGDPDALVVEDLHRSAEAGMPTALYNLGMYHDEGIVVEKDESRAAEFYLRAAEGGHGFAMGVYGEMLREGRGVPVDEKAAVEWFRRGIEAGVVVCYAELGDCYEYGAGVEKDLGKALELYEVCIENGFEPVAPAIERVKKELGRS